jgi:glyceraldehyde-3-phosphate dehydrogenase [NAD(P)+]
VEKRVYESFKAKLVKKLESVKVGDPREKDTDIGPLIDPKAADEMMKAVEEGVKKGLKLLVGGERIGPTYVKPTLLEVTDKEALKGLRLYESEIFAPVALITSFDNDEEAIELANKRKYGLDASVFGEDIARIRKFLRYLEVGAIYVNDMPRHGVGYYPFGGRKASGIGREGIGYSIEHVTALKTIVYNYRGRGVWRYIAR